MTRDCYNDAHKTKTMYMYVTGTIDDGENVTYNARMSNTKTTSMQHNGMMKNQH